VTTAQSTGSMVFPPITTGGEERHFDLLLAACEDDERDWIDWTPVDVVGTDPGLREAFTLFSGALDGYCMNWRVAVVRDIAGRINVFGPPSWTVTPFSFIEVNSGAEVGGMSDILTAFEQVRGELGLNQREMLKSTGIKHRTYHSWKKKPAGSRPRVSSQGRFWRLVDALEDVREAVDRPLSQWIRGSRERIDAILDGRFDDLIDMAIGKAPRAKRSIGASTRSGIAADVPTPIMRTGKTNVVDVEDVV
jgi:hypothetical protein